MENIQGPNYIANDATIEVTRDGALVTVAHPERRYFALQDQTTSRDGDPHQPHRRPLRRTGRARRHRRLDHPRLLEAADFLDLGGALVMAFGGVVSLSDRRWRVGAAAEPGTLCPIGAGRVTAMRRILYLLPVILFMALAGYFAMALRPDHDPRELPSALIDQEAPSFSLAGLDGPGVTRDGLKGSAVLINFFASWCVPCRVEHPLLMRLAERDHVPLYGIDYKDQPADATKLLAHTGILYKAGGTGTRMDGLALDFGVYGVPETYVMDSAGTSASASSGR